MSSKVTSKGQVTIPKSVRDMLQIDTGTDVVFRVNDRREIVLQRADGKELISRFDRFRGIAGPGLTTDEIMVLTRGDDWRS